VEIPQENSFLQILSASSELSACNPSLMAEVRVAANAEDSKANVIVTVGETGSINVEVVSLGGTVLSSIEIATA